MWKKIKLLFARLFRRARELFVILARDVADDVLALLNDPDLQALAVQACRDAAAAGLRGDDAWRYAFAHFLDELKKRGRDLATNIVETILQTAYTVWKASGKL